MNYDLAVVGAGVAGSVAAYHAAKKGLKVVLLEKERLPRHKLCGGAITEKTVNLLKNLGMTPDRQSLGLEIENVTVKVPGGEKSIKISSGKIYTTYRNIFDNFLAMKAQEAGAELFQDTFVRSIDIGTSPVLYIRGGDEIRAKYIIGSDGFYSLVARETKLRESFPKNQLAIAAEYEIKGNFDIDAMEIHFGRSSFSYSWIFPKEDGVTIGVAELGSKLKSSIKDYLDNFVKAQNFLYGTKLPVSESFAIPMGGIKRVVANDRVALAGDAAGFVDSLSGEGIYYAALSGYLAAEAVKSALQGGSLKDYQRTTDREILPDLRALLRIAKLFYFNMGFSYYLFEESDILQNIITLLAGDIVRPRDFYRDAFIFSVRKFPSYILKNVIHLSQ